MSYETTMNFLTHAATYKEIDKLQTPSSQIVLGRVKFFLFLIYLIITILFSFKKLQVPKVGTGMFDVLHKLK